jgi:cytochrome b
VKVWDLPIRLFHWLIVALIAFSWWSGETGRMDWHYRSGLAALVLLIFRLLWGVIGSSTARFSHFVKPPAGVVGYLRRPAGSPHLAGHNPIGGYSVIAMLLALTVQIGTGLFAVDVDGLESGPLSPLVTFRQGRTAADLHETSFAVLQGLIVLHLLAIVYYRLRGRRLILPMVTGRDPQLGADAGEARGGGLVRAALALGLALGLAWWVSLGAPLSGA